MKTRSSQFEYGGHRTTGKKPGRPGVVLQSGEQHRAQLLQRTQQLHRERAASARPSSTPAHGTAANGGATGTDRRRERAPHNNTRKHLDGKFVSKPCYLFCKYKTCSEKKPRKEFVLNCFSREKYPPKHESHEARAKASIRSTEEHRKRKIGQRRFVHQASVMAKTSVRRSVCYPDRAGEDLD